MPETASPRGGASSRFDLYQKSNLTRNQLQVWLGQALLPDRPIYNLTGALTILGELDVNCFRSAFQALIDSSDALRISVEEVDGIPTQKILPELPYAMELLDFSSLPEPRSRARRWTQERCKTPLDWQRGLFESVLIKVSGNEFVWYLNVHHLICDGWSFELVYRHMSDLYERLVRRRPFPAAPLPPFADYLAYEHSYRDSSRRRKVENYGTNGVSENGDALCFYGKLPGTVTTAIRRVSHDLGLERTDRLRLAASGAGSPPQQTSLLQIFGAILIAYLHCLNGKSGYTIGVPFHNRRAAAFKETIGFFSEVLPIHVEVAEDETFASLIKKIKSEIFKALRHGQHSAAAPYSRRAYETVINYHTRSLAEFAGMPAIPQWVYNGHGDDSLAVQIHDFGASGSLSLDFDLHESIFDEPQSQQVVEHFLRILDSFLADADSSLRDLSLLAPEEARRVLIDWNHAEAEPAATQCVHRLFEEQAGRHPQATAVIDRDERLTYAELNRRANQLARYLQKRGVGPDSLVVVYLERSLDMIVALLGILKAGAAFVPLDSRYPAAWLRFVLENAQAPIMLTQDRLLDSLPAVKLQAICLDSVREAVASERTENMEPIASEDHLAYVIYTSGSTGAPKGVEIPRKALANFAVQAAELLALRSTDRVLQFASIGFDAAMEEIFPCLISGATLVLRTDSMLESAAVFLAKCREWQITVLDLPTSYWHDLTVKVFSDDLSLPEKIRLIVIGGERALPERLALWQACINSRVRLLNTYGPTETTVTATACDLTEHCDDVDSPDLPIGRPLPHVQTYVLDRNLRPVPIGVPGELFIGGLGLARGYLNQPELTAERFVQNPFSDKPGTRLYRTGDRVRYRPDGNLEFLGRIDRQVKIRGFRVEPEGIETVLEKHPLVQKAAVVQDATSTKKPLIAHLVPKTAAVLNLDELKQFARQNLPEYMVPAVFLTRQSLPQTPKGKVDRRALSAPEGIRCAGEKFFIAPQTPAEMRIAGIWRDVLGVTEIGRNDHFFELGGHSLLAAQATARMRKEFSTEIPLRAIFENPVLADLAYWIGQSDKPVEPAALPAAPRKRELPLSFSQSRIWFMHQFAPRSAAYNIAAPIRFTGTLNKEALRRSLEEMIRRHDSLRTTFRSSAEEPVQVIGAAQPFKMPEIDLRFFPEDRRLIEAKRLLREEARRPFDLENGPLLRLLLVRLEEHDHVMLLTMHHVISDHWSFNAIAREVTSLYNRFCKQLASPLEPVPVQYADFVVWQDRQLSGESLAAQFSYWTKQLAEMQPLALPSDRPRPAVQTFHGAYHSVELSTELIEQLKRLSVEANATLYMIFLAAFKVLLSRTCNQDDIAVGSPVANRNRMEWEGVIGTFVNILVLRTDLSGNPTAREALARVCKMVIDALSNQDLPFDRLIEQLHPERDPSRAPLVQVLFNFHHALLKKLDLTGLSWMPFEIDQGAAQFDLTVTVDPDTTRRIVIVYNTDLYDPATIARMLAHYHRILQAMVADPDQPVATLPLLSDSERHEILVERNATQADYPQCCIHDLFETQARKTPESVAVIFGREELTYRSLNRRADELAGHLRAMGVGPDVTVGICMERSPDLVIGLLAILKSGGAYVPIDPAYPRDRINFILRDSGTAVLLTQRRLISNLPAAGARILAMEGPWDFAGREAERRPGPPARPENLAYVIYTSGSTGEPKGVEVEHRALVNFLHSFRERPALTEQDVLLSVTTPSFDIAALELFLPLITGARVVLASREVAADGGRLIQELQRCQATVMQATPATWRLLLEAGWTGTKPFKILCGGEALPLELARSLIERASSVWNLYGPTEATVWSTVWEVDGSAGAVSIGRPINNTRVYVVDANRQPVPAGSAGELWIGGQGVARGYHNREALTSEKFVSDPFCSKPGARIFKTGDLVRYLPDGNLEWLGRIDQQIKIRGHRVEPGEIEALLERHPAIKQAVVVAREDQPGEKELLAYLVPEQDAAVTADALREFLDSQLPAYMRPSRFAFLDALPRTPNGKLNRRALPPPEESSLKLSESFAAPADKVEHQLAQIWERLLGVKPISRTGNFFDLGGHSLMAARLMAQVEKIFAKQLPLTAFIAQPTLDHLAELLRQQGYHETWSSLVALQPNGSKPPFFWIHGDKSNWRLPKYLDKEQPLYGILHQSENGERVRHKTVETVAAHYLEEIQTVQAQGPYFLGGYSFGGLVAFEIAQQLHRQGQEVGFLALLEPTTPANGDSHKIDTGTGGALQIAAAPVMHAGYYWNRLAQLDFLEMRAYILHGIKWRYKAKLATIKDWGKKIACKAYLRTDRRIPPWLRGTYALGIYTQAAQTYLAQSYPGVITLFEGEKWQRMHGSFWEQVAIKGLDIHLLKGNHMELTGEAVVRAWGSRLSVSLQNAQEKHASVGKEHVRP